MRSTGNDDRLTLLPLFFFGPPPDYSAGVGISCFYNGSYDEGLAYMKEIIAAANPKMPDPLNGPLEAALQPGTLPAYTGTESTTAWPGSGQYWRSGFLKNELSDDAIDTIIEEFPKAPKPPAGHTPQPGLNMYKQDDLSFGFIESLGGAIARVGKTDTAFYWRDQLFSFTFIGVYDPSVPDWGDETKEWADGFRDAMGPYFSGGVYVNYMQAELPNWQTAYYGQNYTQLRRIKVKYDGDHLFSFPQDLLQPT